MKDLLESTTGGKAISNAISKINESQKLKDNNKSLIIKIVEKEKEYVNKAILGSKWFIGKLEEFGDAKKEEIISSLLNDGFKLKDNNKNNNDNAGTQKVNYNYKQSTSSIRSNIGSNGTFQTTNKNNESVKEESKKDVVNVDNGIFGYEPILNNLSKKEQKELKSYISNLVEKFDKKIPKNEKERDELVQEFKNHIYFVANNMGDDSDSLSKNNIDSIKVELQKEANKFLKKDITAIKEDLKDSAYEEITRKYNYVFKLAKQQADGKKIDSNINIEKETKRLEELLKDVKDSNRDIAEYMMTETRNDLEYIKNKNYQSYSTRISQYIENKNIKEV